MLKLLVFEMLLAVSARVVGVGIYREIRNIAHAPYAHIISMLRDRKFSYTDVCFLFRRSGLN